MLQAYRMHAQKADFPVTMIRRMKKFSWISTWRTISDKGARSCLFQTQFDGIQNRVLDSFHSCWWSWQWTFHFVWKRKWMHTECHSLGSAVTRCPISLSKFFSLHLSAWTTTCTIYKASMQHDKMNISAIFFLSCVYSVSPEPWANSNNNNARSTSVGFKSDECLGKMGMRGRYPSVPHHTIPHTPRKDGYGRRATPHLCHLDAPQGFLLP